MCISSQAFAMFLNLIAAPLSTEPGLITVHAEVGDVQWIQVGDTWCTSAPKEQGDARFAELDSH